MAKISVIIPVYNAEDYLEQCLGSVCAQTLSDIEIICINDGSKDGSKKIIDRFAKKDKRIKVIHKENTGYGDTMNRGLSVASGEYIGIVESDDFIERDMFEALYSLTEGGTVDLVKSNFWDCYDEDNGTITRVENDERKDMPLITRSFTAREYPQILWGHPSIWTAIYKRQMLLDNNIVFKKVKGGGWVDNPFFFETMFAAKTVKWTKTPYYCYRKTNENSSSKGYDLRIPFERMEDNLSVSEKMHHMDEETRKVLYARALMYTVGATEEPHYGYHEDEVRPYMQRMLSSIDQNVIEDDFNVWDKKHFYKYRSPLLDVMPKSAKLLIYNWVQFDNPMGAGGGVTVYCKNLVASIMHYRPDVQVYFLSSGWAYDLGKEEIFVRKTKNIFGDRCRTFEIVNSPVPAPQDTLFYNPQSAFENKALKKVFSDFMEKNGPFHCVHLNNIEGISLDILDLKKDFSKTKFIYSMHNYVPICMTGFYFRRDKHKNCTPDHDKKDCGKCINRNDNRGIRKELIRRALLNTNDPSKYDEFGWLEKLGLDNLDDIVDEKYLYQFSDIAKEKINKNMDLVLAVSERVREIAEENGIEPGLIITNYIGTKIASYQICMSSGKNNKALKAAFLGTDINNAEKGYPFLLDALSRVDAETASNIDLVLTTTTPGCDGQIRQRLKRFRRINIVHGYSHPDLPRILKGVNLGIVPHLWEDNLPQVAIEMAALGIPILCSSSGGAKELCSSDKFVFKSGDAEDFIKKLKFFVKNRKALDGYWKKHKGLKTLREHFDEMAEFYELPEPGKAVVDVEEYSRIVEENEFLYRSFGEGRSPGEMEFLRLRNEVEQYRSALSEKDNEIKNLSEHIDYLQHVIDETRKSMSYKIGLAVTELPRKLRKK